MQPKKTKLDSTPRICPVCGMRSARLMRRDHYLSLFFIPLIPVKRGQEFLECERCGVLTGSATGQTSQAGFQGPSGPVRSRCPVCGRKLEADFAFCPSCGQRL